MFISIYFLDALPGNYFFPRILVDKVIGGKCRSRLIKLRNKIKLKNYFLELIIMLKSALQKEIL